MRKRTALIAMATLPCVLCADVQARVIPSEKPRILISTDIGGTDPDDNQ